MMPETEEMRPITKKFKVGYGTKRGFFSPYLELRAIEYIEAESITKATKIAQDTASKLGYEVDIIKEVDCPNQELDPTIHALVLNAYLRGKAEGKLESQVTHENERRTA